MVTDTITRIVADCEQYWLKAGIPAGDATEMRAELELHLAHAAEQGKPPEVVVGTDLAGFAEAWAREQRPEHPVPSWEEVEAAESRGRRRGAWTTAAVATGIGAAIALTLLVSDLEEADMDDQVWMWIWLGTAGFFAFAEIVTAGFFMLPFAVGAAAAFILALIGVPVGVQWAVFLIISVAALFGLRSFVKREDEHQHAVGANRYLGAHALVLEVVDRTTGTGRVRMDTEDWRATTTGGPLPAGAVVTVTGVTGSRLIVEAIES